MQKTVTLASTHHGTRETGTGVSTAEAKWVGVKSLLPLAARLGGHVSSANHAQRAGPISQGPPTLTGQPTNVGSSPCRAGADFDAG